MLTKFKFTFNTQRTDKDGKVPIRLEVTISGHGRVTRDTLPIRVFPEMIKGGFEVSRKEPNHELFNAQLSKIKSIMLNIVTQEFKGEIKVTPELVRNRLENKPDVDRPSAPEFWDRLSEYLESTAIYSSVDYIDSLRSCFNIVREFSEKQNYQLTFESANSHLFYEKFTKFCFEVKKYSDNTTAKRIERVRVFLKWCLERNYFPSELYLQNVIKVRSFDKTHVVLTRDEFKKLYEHSFASNRLEKVKNIFCMMCATGFRISDLKDLRPENIHLNEGYIEKVVVKTKERIRIPLNKYSREILEKYGNLLSTGISNQKLNDYIKECCKEIGINTPVQVSKSVGGKVIHEIKPKYELISNHTARKTFATLMLLSKQMPNQAIMKLTGHRQESAFRAYVGVQDDEVFEMAGKAWDLI